MATSIDAPFSIEMVRGEPFQVGNRQIVPIAKRARLRVAWQQAGVTAIWLRPIAVEVHEGDTTRRIEVVDVGARIWLGLLLLAILARLAAGTAGRRR